MRQFHPFSLNIDGQLKIFNRPLVMGILNVTPDSFFAKSRCGNDESAIRKRIREIVAEGADIIDIGGYSSRPGADDVSPDEEFDRLSLGLRIATEEAPCSIISIDTFRSEVAERCIEKFGALIVNDISAGTLDANMIPTVAQLHVPYIMMHMKGNPQTMGALTQYDNLVAEILQFLGQKADEAAQAGIADIIIDPGFGFGKTVEQNYVLLENLDLFHILNRPVLAGLSRKSMIYKLLATDPDHALNGTTAAHMIALMQGAAILRVHDVRQAVETVKIYDTTILQAKNI